MVFWGPFMTQLDSTVVNVSLTTIRDDLHATLTGAHWVVSAYLLALALTLPLNGWLVDRVGAKRLYLLCFGAFSAASVACGCARTIGALIAARVAQGVAGGLLAPMTSLMIARAAGAHLARAMGYTAVPILLAPIVGPILAGAVLHYARWPALFYINVPVGVVAIGLAARLLPDGEARRGSEGPQRGHGAGAPLRRPFDGKGFLLLSPGLGCVLFGLEELAHGRDVAVLVAGLAALTAFVVHARRQGENALLDLSLFRDPNFCVGVRTQFIANGVIYAGQLLIPLYMTVGERLDAPTIGWVMAPMGVGMMCSQPLMGPLTERFGCRNVATCGVLLTLLGTLPFAWMLAGHFSVALAAAALLLRGLGQGATGIPSSSVAYAAVPRQKLASGATAINIVQRLGGPLATTALGIVLSLANRRPTPHLGQPFAAAFALLLSLQLALLASALSLPTDDAPAQRSDG